MMLACMFSPSACVAKSRFGNHAGERISQCNEMIKPVHSMLELRADLLSLFCTRSLHHSITVLPKSDSRPLLA